MKMRMKYLFTGVALVLLIIYATDYKHLTPAMTMICPYMIGVALGFWCGDIKENNRRHRR